MFLEPLSYNQWYNTSMKDFYYQGKLDAQNNQVSTLKIPFFQLPYEMLMYLIEYFKIPSKIYKWKAYPFISYLQWLSAMESCFVYVNLYTFFVYIYNNVFIHIINIQFTYN